MIVWKPHLICLLVVCCCSSLGCLAPKHKSNELVKKTKDNHESGTKEKDETKRFKHKITIPNIDVAKIPAGKFRMGTDSLKALDKAFSIPDLRLLANECPAHEVEITKPFFVSTTEITQGHWRAVMGSEPWKGKDFVAIGTEFPATHINWIEAKEFCKRLSKESGVTCRLPTEAEWEYSCRAGSKGWFSFGDSPEELEKHAWYAKNSATAEHFHPGKVGLKAPNAFGLYDMHGNVYEWCEDSYTDEYYAESPRMNPKNSSKGNVKVFRGGSWDNQPYRCRSAYRYFFLQGFKSPAVGFRVVFESEPKWSKMSSDQSSLKKP